MDATPSLGDRSPALQKSGRKLWACKGRATHAWAARAGGVRGQGLVMSREGGGAGDGGAGSHGWAALGQVHKGGARRMRLSWDAGCKPRVARAAIPVPKPHAQHIAGQDVGGCRELAGLCVQARTASLASPRRGLLRGCQEFSGARGRAKSENESLPKTRARRSEHARGAWFLQVCCVWARAGWQGRPSAATAAIDLAPPAAPLVMTLPPSSPPGRRTRAAPVHKTHAQGLLPTSATAVATVRSVLGAGGRRRPVGVRCPHRLVPGASPRFLPSSPRVHRALPALASLRPYQVLLPLETLLIEHTTWSDVFCGPRRP